MTPTESETMTSREIAEVIKKPHSDLLKSIRKQEIAWEKVTGKKFLLTHYQTLTGGGGTRDNPEYLLNKRESLFIATKFNDEARARLILKWEEKETQIASGKLFTHAEVKHILNLCKLFAYEEPRKEAERKHFDWYNDKYTWNKYRQGLLGYTVSELKSAVLRLGIKYKNQSQALIHIDKYKLIYNAVVDLFVALGRSEEYAMNVAQLCYDIAKAHPEFWTWDRKQNALFPPRGINKLESQYFNSPNIGISSK